MTTQPEVSAAEIRRLVAAFEANPFPAAPAFMWDSYMREHSLAIADALDRLKHVTAMLDHAEKEVKTLKSALSSLEDVECDDHYHDWCNCSDRREEIITQALENPDG